MGPLDIVDALLFMEDTPRGRRKWRLMMAISVVVLMGHMAWACGLIPNMDGFALAGEVKQSQKAVSRIEVKLLEMDILDTIKQKCTAEDKRFLASKLRDLRVQWLELTGRQYDEPQCDEL